MAVEQHSQYPAWNEALERLVEAERNYHIALMERRTTEEIQRVARVLDEARTRYLAIANQIEQDDASDPRGVNLPGDRTATGSRI